MTFPQNHHLTHPKNLQYQKYPHLKLCFTSASPAHLHFMFYSPTITIENKQITLYAYITSLRYQKNHKEKKWRQRKLHIEYRQVRKEDGYEWYTLLDEVWRATYSHIFPKEVFDGRDYAREERARNFTEEKFIGERKIAYVAECEGKIVGLMFGTLDSDYEHFKNDYADLTALYVYPEYQGKGIGSKLRDIFVEWAKSKNAEKYVIGVLKDNTRARKVYESWGGKLSEHEHDFVVMNVGYPENFYTFKI